MSSDKEQAKQEDSVAIDGMLRQLAHEDASSSSAFVSRVMEAVQDAEEEMHPTLIVIPTRFIALAASAVVAIGLVLWIATRPAVYGVVTSEPVFVVDGQRLEKRLPGEGLFEGETIRGRRVTTFKLVDGSMVTVDNGTLLTLEEPEADERIRLNLVKGKALFRVEKGTGRFLVNAGVPVEVLGTTFGMRRENAETVTSVYEGRVQMGGETGLILTRGQSAHVEYGSQHPVDHLIPPNRELSWARPEVVFDDAPLKDVLSWLTQNSSFVFVVNDSTLNDLPVSVHFKRSADLDTTVTNFLAEYSLDQPEKLSVSVKEETF